MSDTDLWFFLQCVCVSDNPNLLTPFFLTCFNNFFFKLFSCCSRWVPCLRFFSFFLLFCFWMIINWLTDRSFYFFLFPLTINYNKFCRIRLTINEFVMIGTVCVCVFTKQISSFHFQNCIRPNILMMTIIFTSSRWLLFTRKD